MLFSITFYLMADVIVRLMRSALRAAHGAQKVEQEVSDYYIAAELETTSRGMMIAIPE